MHHSHNQWFKGPNPRGSARTSAPLGQSGMNGKDLRTESGTAKAARMTTSPLMATLHVALGGAIGSVLRYQLGRGMTHWLGAQAVTAFPWATLAVNLVGSLAMGLLAGWLARHGPESFGGG